MSTTPNMSLVVPDVGTSGPAYATQINTAMDVIDAHDHTVGKGSRIPPSGLNINADLTFNSNDAISLRSTRYVAQTGVLATADDKNAVYSVNGNLYWNNANGVAVQITSGNGLNFSSLGAIGGDYGAVGVTASAVYTNALKTFSWLQAASQFAKMAVGDLQLYSTTAGTQAVTLKASATTAAYDLTLPIASPAANTFIRNAVGGQQTFVTVNGTANQITVTQNTSDMTLSIPSNAILPGGVPIGSIVAIGDVGAWALPASGAIKDGWALCNGQAKPVGSAAGLGANLPDLTDDRFLNGSTAVGGTGGATSKTTTGIAASFAKNLLNTDQIGHIHGMQHIHQWTNVSSQSFYSYDANGSSQFFMFQSYTNNIDSGLAWYYIGLDVSSRKWFTKGARTIGDTSDRDFTDSQAAIWLAGPTVSTTVTQGTISDIRPKYFNVVYLMRVA